MPARRIGALDLTLSLEKGRIEGGLAARLQAIDLTIKSAAKPAHRFERYDHERAGIETDDAEKIVVLELASDGLGGFLSIQDAVSFPHAAGLVDDQDHGAVFFLALGLF